MSSDLEQLNAKGREYYRAHAAQIRQQKLEYYHANATEIKPRQREYMRRRRAEEKTAKVALGAESKTASKKNIQAIGLIQREPSASRANAHTHDVSSGVKKWLAYRESQKGVLRQDPIERWKAYRKAQLQKTTLKSRDHSRALEKGERVPKASKGASVKQKRGPKNDLSL